MDSASTQAFAASQQKQSASQQCMSCKFSIFGFSQCRQQIWAQIWEMWGPPVDPLPDPQAVQEAKLAGQAANRASLVHELDLFCRAEISNAMQKLASDKVLSGLLHVDTCESILRRKKHEWSVFIYGRRHCCVCVYCCNLLVLICQVSVTT